MQKQIKILLTLLMSLALAVSCSSPNDPSDSNTFTNDWKNNPNFSKLKQKWQDNDTTYGISQYIITDNKFENLFDSSVNYSFTIEEIVWGSDNTSGIIYGQYTANTYSPELVGKYYAVSFKSLTSESVSISGAYKSDGVSATDTLEEAKTTFTEANGYFGQYSDCKVVFTVYYGSKSAEVDINDQAKLKELWVGLVANQIVYGDSGYKWKSGEFKADANYYEPTWDSGNSPRTKYVKNVTYEYNGKLYLAGIYWDNKPSSMPSSYRLIIIDEKGVEQAWYGGGSDEAVIPDENTQWTKYDFVFGYIQNY